MEEKGASELLKDESFTNYCLGSNPEDVQYWERWLSEHPDQAETVKQTKLAVLMLGNEALQQVTELEYGKLQDRIRSAGPAIRKSFPLVYKWTIAASFFICCTLGYLAYKNKNQEVKPVVASVIAPGSNKAILTLSGGKRIVLDAAQHGEIALDGDAAIKKTSEGQIVYDAENKMDGNTETVFNTMTTPRGGQYHLTLSDGTRVWLNAASSIRYPTTFSGKDRNVEITGEVYFEVAPNKERPFNVATKDQRIEVLGTHFNINAYGNEINTKTTLLEGSVKVIADHKTKLLKPGQQSLVTPSEISINEVDPTEVIAWKEGYFDFTDADIETVMRQISRWYDVDVKFEGKITSETFTGRIPRNWNLNQVIRIIQSSNSVHLNIQGRRIMVKQ